MGIFDIVLSSQVERVLHKVPLHIVRKLHVWIDDVIHSGLRETRKISGYHDEPLKGDRLGQRSVRLSRGYRLIYRVERRGLTETIKILEINKHDY